MGVLVDEGTKVLVATGVNVLVGRGVLVGMFGVGDANNATRVNSAATVSAAWVNTASGAACVTCAEGRLHPTNDPASKNMRMIGFISFTSHLLNNW